MRSTDWVHYIEVSVRDAENQPPKAYPEIRLSGEDPDIPYGVVSGQLIPATPSLATVSEPVPCGVDLEMTVDWYDGGERTKQIVQVVHKKEDFGYLTEDGEHLPTIRLPKEKEKGEIRGKLVDAEGTTGLLEARVTLTRLEDGFARELEVKDGSYKFAELRIGRYKVEASCTGYSPVEKIVEVAEGAATTLDLQLYLGRMRGDLYLKLDAIEPAASGEGSWLRDASGNNNHATIHGDPTIVADERFGASLRLGASEAADYLELPDGIYKSAGFTVSAWVLREDVAAGPSTLFSLAARGPGGGQIALRLRKDGQASLLSPGVGKALVGKPVDTGQWTHLAAVVERTGEASLYVDGEAQTPPVTVRAPEDVEAWAQSIGGSTPQDRFRGRLAHFRLYPKALRADELLRQLALDELPALDFSIGSPLAFDLWDENQEPTIYVDDGRTSHPLTVVLSNEGRQALELRPPSDPSALQGTDPEALEAYFKDNHHLELRVPRGTLSSPARDQLHDLEKTLPPQASRDGWLVLHRNSPQPLTTTSLYFLYLCKGPKTIGPSSELTETGREPWAKIELPGVAADRHGGARVAPVELRPGPLTRRAEDGAVIVGPRIQDLHILSHRGRKQIPLHIGFVGNNKVLNDGKTPTPLLLRITNIDPTTPLHMVTKGNGLPETRFIFKSDHSGRGAKEWALTDEPGKVTLQVAGPDGNPIGGHVSHDTPDPTDPDPAAAEMDTWTIPASKLLAPSQNELLGPRESIYLRLNVVQTRQPSGPAHLWVHHENIPGYWDDETLCTIEKGPLVFAGHNVGIGRSPTEHSLDVAGDVDATGTVSARVLEGDGRVPVGAIIMWSGRKDGWPKGWVLCDGNNNTPDLRGRFIMGSASGPAGLPGTQGADYGPPDTHTHPIAGFAFINLRTKDSGKHNHVCSTADEWGFPGTSFSRMKIGFKGSSSNLAYSFDSTSFNTHYAGSHYHHFDLERPDFESGASSGPNRPAWYALCFIMKVALPQMITLNKSSVGPGAQIVATLPNVPHGNKDWVAIVDAGSPTSGYKTPPGWRYVNQLTGTPKAWNVAAPTEHGTYEIRLFLNDSYDIAARSEPFTVRTLSDLLFEE